jgi:DNA repair protein RadA/Sms
MPKARIVFVCRECGKESARWLGRCPACSAWNSFAEQTVANAPAQQTAGPLGFPQELSMIEAAAEERWQLPNHELNRVLGGGLVPGSLVLIGGEPGIGKSTLLLQAAADLAASRGEVVYASGEETLGQVKLRARRMGIGGERLYLVAENNLEYILAHLDKQKPAAGVVDSIQSVYLPDVESSPGSVAQVRECTLRLVQWAKQNQTPLFITGHVTKEGSIAGPRILEHMVDTVLYFEGEPSGAYRVLRAVKNRFGSVSEVGIFEMREKGLVEVDNPSQLFLAERDSQAVGTAVTAAIEGSRPIMVVIEALNNPSAFAQTRRVASGIDFNRLLLITAVLNRRLGLRLGNQDVLVNVAGGIRIEETAADLAVALAIASSVRDQAVDPACVAVGEVGLTGEVRSVPQLERRVNEAARLGFKRIIVPRYGLRGLPGKPAIEVVPAATVREALRAGLLPKTEQPGQMAEEAAVEDA